MRGRQPIDASRRTSATIIGGSPGCIGTAPKSTASGRPAARARISTTDRTLTGTPDPTFTAPVVVCPKSSHKCGRRIRDMQEITNLTSGRHLRAVAVAQGARDRRDQSARIFTGAV